MSYRVTGANWTPVYEARLTAAADKPEISLVRRAELRQRTGEDWSDVALTLSTTRSAGGTRAPDLAADAGRCSSSRRSSTRAAQRIGRGACSDAAPRRAR